MNITFLLPNYAPAPIGGFKIVYEYANRLTERGHRVTVVHPRSMVPLTGIVNWVKGATWGARMQRKEGRLIKWFPLRPDVEIKMVPDMSERYMPDADVIFGTDILTTREVASYSAAKGAKFCIVQHYETWVRPEAEVNEILQLPLHKVVVAKWLQTIVCRLNPSDPPTYIPSGMDFGHLYVEKPIESRSPRVGMLGHIFDWKGTSDAVKAVETARKRSPGLRAAQFGTEERPSDLPQWIDYVRRPSPDALRKFYNDCSIFIQASWSEGWGLTATEAMACGCALLTTDNGGSQDYALPEKTALVAPPRCPEQLAAQLLRILEDDALRIRLAQAGVEHITKYTWERAVDSFDTMLRTRVGQAAR